MKQALYGIAGGLAAGLLFLSFMFFGPLSQQEAAISPTATESVQPSATLTAEATASPEVTESPIALCSVLTEAQAEGILQLQAQVIDTSTSAVLFERNASLASRTASVLKLITAAAALETLGPDYTVTTRVYVDVNDPGIIYLVGAGDVTLSRTGKNQQSVYRNAPKISTLVSQITKAMPGATFSQIVLDTSLYGAANGDWKTDWDTKGIKEGYMSRVSALQFDGDRTDPTGKDSARTKDPVASAGKWFKEAIGAPAAEATLSVGQTPIDAVEIAKVSSRPISEWIDYMLLVSDNTLAEALSRLIALDAGYSGNFATLDTAYKKALNKTGLDFGTLHIEDGSGLSDYNAASPAFINALLQLVDQGYGDFEVIKEGLPVAGTPGSLSYRLESAAGKIAAKTGWIQSGYTMAGFMDTPDGSHLIFTIYNLGKVSTANRDALDALAMAIYNCGGQLGND